MIHVPYKFHANFSLPSYSSLENRIRAFDDVEIIGKDASGKYNMYAIHLGNQLKPPIMVQASMHSTEWHGAMYSMRFMEELRDNTFPDKQFVSELLRNHHVIYIPVVNPWGWDQTTEEEPIGRNNGRANSNKVDLNRDFSDFTQIESRNVKAVLDKNRPFAFLDIHLIVQNREERSQDLIVGNGQYQTTMLRDLIGYSWGMTTGNPHNVQLWEPYTTMTKGLARRYVRDMTNPHTPYTLAYITELTRPDPTRGSPLTKPEIMHHGMVSMYLFFITSMQYYKHRTVDVRRVNQKRTSRSGQSNLYRYM